MTDEQTTGEIPPYETTEFIYPFYADLMKHSKATLVQMMVNPSHGPRWVDGLHHPRKWKKNELAWHVAGWRAREAYDAGKTGI